jgi:glycosyltransferase involved in cell wall biosynthesis
MRIVINGWFWQRMATGSGQYLAALADWLPRAGPEHELVVVTSEPIDRQSTAQLRFVEARTPFDRLGKNLAKLWFEQVTFPLQCRRLSATVALVPYWGSPWWRPCPVIVTIHDLIPLLLPLYRGGPLQRAYTWLVSRTARRADAVLTDSEASRRDIIAHLGIRSERVHAIHLAVDPRFGPITDRGELARVRTRYQLPEEPFLLYLGGFDARKNVLRIVQAYARMVEAPRLVIAGKTPDDHSPFAPDPVPLVRSLGLDNRVLFTGWVDEADKPALYSLAAGALFISEYEGFGLPVLEAMACGCPVITAQSG